MKDKRKAIHFSGKQLAVYGLTVTAAILLSNLLKKNMDEFGRKIVSCTMDGAFVWAADKSLVLGLIPIIMTVYTGIIIDIQLRPICVARTQSRWKIWLEEEKIIWILSAATIVYAMILSTVMSYILNHGVMTWNDITAELPWCGYHDMLMLSYGDRYTIWEFSYLRSVILVVLINSIEITILVTAGNLMYWTTGKRISSVLAVAAFCVPVGINRSTTLRWLTRYGFKMMEQDFYAELMVPARLLKVCILLVLCIVFLYLWAKLVVKRKNFY
ncbi:MAG: hypothetical protein J5981_05890 [Lachnospira sp.]|nr:hypothetical protein [Lachnospira sp.]